MKAEPSFLQLAKDFKLDTSSNGQSIADSTRTRSAQSICWNILLQPSNSSVYEQVIPLIRNKNYERFKPYPIMEGVSMPRLPSFKVADEQVKKLHDDGLILLGHSHEPQSHSRWNIIDCHGESSYRLRILSTLLILLNTPCSSKMTDHFSGSKARVLCQLNV